MIYIFSGLLIIGAFFVGYWLRKFQAASQVKGAETKAEKIVADAKTKQSEILLESQNKALQIIDEAKKEDARRRKDISELQTRLEKRETVFSQKLLELQDKQQQLYDKVNKVEEIKEKIKEIKEEQLAKLEKIAQMTKDEAKEVLFKNVEEGVKEDLISRINKLEKESTDTLEEKARDVMASTMQRLPRPIPRK